MDRNPPFDDLVRWPWPGTASLKMPMAFPDLSLMAAVFTASASEAARLLPDRRMRAVVVTPGRCLVAIGAVRYRESELGAYDELALTIPIAFGTRGPPALVALGQGLSRAFSAWVWQLAVTTERSRDAGVTIAGFPKQLAELAFDQDGRRRRCTLAFAGDRALSFECDGRDDMGERQLRLRAYTTMDGLPLVSTLLVRQTRFRDRFAPRDARLELGAGPLADALARLRLAERPLGSHVCSQARAVLFPPRNAIDA